ncbi:TPR repeat protein [Methylohalomonas lacus]|uniref:TPR repeat protein n=1 Tax=Methylohalomonas lacus TaxID=398773 RepID=A0AAE3HII5_9GAMM|nr:SPOR domain-containing protein [Methylohalomonas lacus]MCS3902970.1 TPR repeat protein [Methylohalomonas lacus]
MPFRPAGLTYTVNARITLLRGATAIVLALWLALLTASPALAQGYNEAKQAYLAKEYDKALNILEPLATEGDSDAQVLLGLMYDYGHGVEADPQTAIDWYTRAARQGLPVVQHDLGVKYFQGKGIERDYDQARLWWQMAANAGLADSQFNLGLMYYRGLGVAQDRERARDLFEQAAAQDHANAQYSLAVMYAFSQGVEQDYERAFKLFEAAADNDIAQAQYNLGVFFENGYGVDKEMDRARYWYKQAAANDIDKAVERLAVLDGDASGAAGSEPEDTATAADDIREATDMAGTSGQFRRDDWLREQSAGEFTIQLISLTDEQSTKQYLQDHALTDRGGYIEVKVDGQRRYNAIYGTYSNYESAQAAITELPTSVQRGQPWVRNFGVLQDLMP